MKYKILFMECNKSFEDRFSVINNKLDNINSRMSKLETKCDSLNKANQSISDSIKLINAKIDHMKNTVDKSETNTIKFINSNNAHLCKLFYGICMDKRIILSNNANQ